MAIVSSQVRFTTPSGAMVNTFHFNDTAHPTYSGHSDAVAAALTNFYNGGGSSSVGAYMAGWVSRSVEIRNYNPNDAKPRVPSIYTFTLAAARSASTFWTIPADVCMCLSVHSSPPITRRKRGRIYLGGPTQEWVQAGTTGALPTWAPGATGMVLPANLASTTLLAAAVGWCIYSRAAEAYYPVIGGHIDSEPDTQRRRGATTSTRSTWGA